MSYDRKCRDLAVLFLGDYYDSIPETKINALAQVIQDAIEDALAGEGKGDAKPEAWEFLNNEFQKIFGSKKDAGTKSD